jgi:RHS repeat-associated protein
VTGSTDPQPSILTYHYDPSGNMTNAAGNGQSWSLTYDEDNRTTSIGWTNGALNDVTIINRYDALGRRIARTADGILTGYVLDLSGDMERVLCDLDAARNITAYYVHGFDLTFKVAPDGSLSSYHADAHGNIIALTDAGANAVAEYAYTPYGRSLGSTNYSPQTTNPYLYAGSQGVMEELPGLYFMRARYYSAEAGVFLSTDPVMNIGPTWIPIAYVYAECNPLRFNDPKGEFLNFIIGAAVGFVSDIVIQTVIEHKSFDEINWGRAAISGAVGALTGGLGGLAAGLNIGLRIAANFAVGAITTALAKPFQNLAAGQGFNFKGLTGADVLVGGVMGAVGGGGSRGGTKGGNLATQWLRKSGADKFLKKYPDLAKTWTAAQRLPWRQFSEWHLALPKGVTDGGVAGLKLLQQAGRGVAWGVGEAGTFFEDAYREKTGNWGFSYIPKLGDPWD